MPGFCATIFLVLVRLTDLAISPALGTDKLHFQIKGAMLGLVADNLGSQEERKHFSAALQTYLRADIFLFSANFLCPVRRVEPLLHLKAL